MTVDEIYELVAMNIYNSIESEIWEKAVLNAEGDNDAMGINGYYILNGTQYPLNITKFDDDVEFALMELHQITTEGDANIWNYAIFTLLPDGELTIDLEWDSDLETL